VKIVFNIKEKRLGGRDINLCVLYVEIPLNRPLVYGDNTECCGEEKGLLDVQIRKTDGCINLVHVVSQHSHRHHPHQIQGSGL